MPSTCLRHFREREREKERFTPGPPSRGMGGWIGPPPNQKQYHEVRPCNAILVQTSIAHGVPQPGLKDQAPKYETKAGATPKSGMYDNNATN